MVASEQAVALGTILVKEIQRFSRIWLQTVIPPVITTSLYFIIFGNIIGSRVGEMEGYRYMDFIVPGLILMSVITNSYSNVVSSFFSAKFQRNIEEMMVSPMPNYVILLGYVGGGIARGLAVGFVVTLVSLLFTDLRVHNALVLTSVVMLTSALFSLGGLINGIFAKSFDDISIVPTFVLAPLTYLGGVFYSITLLPEFWQSASRINPILYMVNAFRYGFLGHSDISVQVSFTIIIGFITVLFGFSLFLMNRGHGLRA